jgi:phytoene synthase
VTGADTAKSVQSDAAIERAKDSLSRNGRSFAWAARFLGQQVGADAAMLYSFCRILDDLADGDIAGGPKRLTAIRTGLLDNAPQRDPALTEFWPVMQRCDVPPEPLIHLLDGLLMDQKPVRLETETDLIRYAYHVAGAVGLLMCPVLGCTSRIAEPFAIDMGIAMQLTNIARDVREDAEMGRRYLPAEWVGDLEPQAILKASRTASEAHHDTITNGTRRLLDLADSYYESGARGLCYLPVRAHLSIGIAGMVYRAIGVKLRKHGLNWAGPRTITSKSEKLAASFTALPSVMQRARRRTIAHDSTLHAALTGYVR